MIEILNDLQIENILTEQVAGHLGCHADDTTYVLPLSYAYQEQYIYFHTTEGLKLQIMRKNPKVCFQVDDRKNMANWKSVIAWGQFEEITDEEERKKALKILIGRHLPMIASRTTHLGGTWPFAPDNLSSIEGIVCRISVQKTSGRFEKNGVSPSFAG